MSTIYVFQNEATIDALDIADKILSYDTSTGLTKCVTGAQVQDKVINTGSTATTIANSGVTTLSTSTSLTKAYTIADPVVGRRVTIANLGSTLARTVTAASTATGASSLTTIGSTSTVLTFSAVDAVVDLIGITTTRWEIVSNVGTVACT